MISQVVGVFSKLLTIGIYAWCVEHLALFALPADSLWVWAGALLLYDFCYYWLHRMGHEVNVLWAAHVVHHQSEDYNLSTALRQTGSGVLLGWLFYLPMALLGVPLQVFVVVALIDLLYQFWVHTEQIGRLGWFDRVVLLAVQPSRAPRGERPLPRPQLRRHPDRVGPPVRHLRRGGRRRSAGVRHARAAAQLEPAVGQRRGVLGDCALRRWHARRWRDKLRVWLKPPGWRPADVAARFPKPAFVMPVERFDPPHVAAAETLRAGAVRLAAGDGHAVPRHGRNAPAFPRCWPMRLYLVAGLCVLGALMEGRRRARWVESLRVAATALVPLLGGPLVWHQPSGRPYCAGHRGGFRTQCAGVAVAGPAVIGRERNFRRRTEPASRPEPRPQIRLRAARRCVRRGAFAMIAACFRQGTRDEFLRKLVRHKTVEQLQAEVGSRGDFRRVLGLWQLTAIGIGGIIGVGIFVLAGQQAAINAGPAVALSFLIAGIGSACAALCYAEFAGLIPVTGSAYTYGYAVLGEFVAWIIGWDLLLEYALVVAVVAIGWSGYVQVLLNSAGVHLPEWAQQSMSAQTMQYYLQQIFGVHGASAIAGPSDGHRFNVIAAAVSVAVAVLLTVRTEWGARWT